MQMHISGNRCAVTGASEASYSITPCDLSPTWLKGVVAAERRPALQPGTGSLDIAGTQQPVPFIAIA
jgi:hypothetical protein